MSEGSNQEEAFSLAVAVLHADTPAVLFATPLLRARELKLATAMRRQGWKVVLLYLKTTPFSTETWFDVVVQADSPQRMHELAKAMEPPLCHVFSGAVDDVMVLFCQDKPGPLVIDMNDVFCPSLLSHCPERFEPTEVCLAQADAFCARDLQANYAERYDGFRLPQRTILFPEYPWANGGNGPRPETRSDDEVRVVSVGTFCLESQGNYDSAYLRIAEMLCASKIHFHIYPHWFYRFDPGSAFNHSLKNDFRDFFRLAEETPYLHIHESKSLDELAQELPRYDFGLVSGGAEDLGQHLGLVTKKYMQACYSGRISDYIDARMPVLINQEVGFNYWLLERYGLVADLKGLLRPGFRQQLFEMKRDTVLACRIEESARRLHQDIQAPRLARFYKGMIDMRPRKSWIPVDRTVLFPKAATVSEPKRTSPRTAKIERRLRAIPDVIGSIAFPIARTRELYRLREHLGSAHKIIEQIRDRGEALEQEKTDLLQKTQDCEKENLALKEALNKKENIISLEKEKISLREALKKENENIISLEKEKFSLREALKKENENIISLEKEKVELLRRLQETESRLNLAHTETRMVGHTISEISDWLGWSDVRDDTKRLNGFSDLVEMLVKAGRITSPGTLPSHAWQVLNEMNLSQLLTDGYANFKRTIGCNYFNFAVQSGDPQSLALEKLLPQDVVEQCMALAKSLPDDPKSLLHDQVFYRYFVAMLWQYACANDPCGILSVLQEPAEGNPMIVPVDGRLATQDLANSVMEYYAVAAGVDVDRLGRVLEIGGGYGRDAFVFLSRHPDLKYVMVDIPPALFLAQRYLMSVFPRHRVFRFRDFNSLEEVREDIEAASVVFLMPHQLEMLPDDWFDLTINISSLGEMTREQICWYFDQIDRTTRGSFYTKQWKLSKNPFDGLELTENDYPVPDHWSVVMKRECAVQVEFFETVYRIGEPNNV